MTEKDFVMTNVLKSDAKLIEGAHEAAAPAANILGRNPSDPDPFDLAALRINPNFSETVGVKKLLTTVPVRKPSKQDFIRVHSGENYRDNFAMIELKDDREAYLVSPVIAKSLPTEVAYFTIYTAINRQGVPFLWPVRLPNSDGRVLDWHVSAEDAAQRAMTQWLRVQANTSLKAYEIFLAEAPIPDPQWPELPFNELLRIAFGSGRLVNKLDHPVIKRLRGLA